MYKRYDIHAVYTRHGYNSCSWRTIALNRPRIHILERDRCSPILSVLIDKLDNTSKTFSAKPNVTLFRNNESRNQKRRHKNITQLVTHWDWKREGNRVEFWIWMWVWPSFFLSLSFALRIFILLVLIKFDVF